MKAKYTYRDTATSPTETYEEPRMGTRNRAGQELPRHTVSSPRRSRAEESDRSGLGLRPKTKGRKKQNDIVALWSENDIRYGRIQGLGLHIHEPNIKGQMIT